METSQTIGKLSTALAKAQGEIRGAAKDTANPFFKSKYADLASVRDGRVPITFPYVPKREIRDRP